MGMKEDGLPSREEFYKTIMKLKKERALKKEGEYYGYLKEQEMRRKPRRIKSRRDGD